MSMPNAFELAQSIATELATMPALADVPVAATLIPEMDLSRIDTQTRIHIVPSRLNVTIVDRASDLHSLEIDLAVQRRLSGRGETDQAQVSELLGLVSGISRYMSRRVLQTQPAVRYRSISVEPLWLPTHLMEERVFTSVMTFTYSMSAQAGA